MKLKAYTIRLCKKDEYDQLVDFFRNYWSPNHVFCRNKRIFEFQHGNAENGYYNFVIAIHNKTQEIHAVLGFISSSTYDATDALKPKSVYGALWKVRNDVHNQEIGKLGLGVLYHVIKSFPEADYITLGLSGFSQQIYNSLHFDFGKLEHYYLASKYCNDFKICEKPEVNNKFTYSEKFLIKNVFSVPSDWGTQYHPEKNAEYFTNRYINHPFYKYELIGIFKENQMITIWIVRKISINGHNCLRIVDMVGDMSVNLDGIEGNIQDLLKEYSAEYIDCYNHGISEEYFTGMGLKKVAGDTIIPNYFEPFEKRNIDIHYASYSKYPTVIFKGDCDQDRPNLLEQLRLRREQALKSETSPFKVLETYAYTDDYEAHEMERCILSPFYLRKEYNGKKTEWTFAQYLDTLPEVEWWLKNGDSGKDYLSIRYTNSQTGELSLFYPDWIVRLTNGVIGIFDTKGGITATSNDTKDKAEELQRRIKYLNSLTREQRYVGGIVRFANGKWYANNSQKYTCNPMNTDRWCLLEDLLV